jgi:SAM-dependent methyltransferase
MKVVPVTIAAILLAGGAIVAGVLMTEPAKVVEKKPHWGKPDILYIPTPPRVVDAMIALAGLKDGDVIYDLGSGDGRIPIAAALKFQVKAVGIDIDPRRITEANANAKAAGVSSEVSFRKENLFTADFRDATVVTLYLLDSLNEQLRPRLLAELKPGTRIVSHSFRMGDWRPERTQRVQGRLIYLWTVPPRDKPADQ